MVNDIFFAGIDLGSTITKVIILDQDESIRASVIKHTGAEHRRLANQIMREALLSVGVDLNDITYIVATGYGRINVPFADRHFTELTCHAKGVSKLFPRVRIAIDIGGQDSKVLKIENAKLIDFVMNDKCAAGTGRFLEVLATTLGIRVEELGELSLEASRKVIIGSPCTVFIRQEVANLLVQGTPIEDIIAGLNDTIAVKVCKMARRFKIEPDVVFTGGVAKNIGVVKALEENLGCHVLIPEEPLLSGALGAAVIAREISFSALAKGKVLPKGNRQLIEAKLFT
jgi:predicted CoA-substrate-specific enzyme activase